MDAASSGPPGGDTIHPLSTHHHRRDDLDYPSVRREQVVGVPPSEMGVGPAYAIPAVLADCGLTTDDIDIFEINEAFASQAPRSRGMASHVEWHPTRHRVAVWHSSFPMLRATRLLALQAVMCVKKLGVPAAKLNPNGGAIALGHPLGSTGARQVTTLLHELHRSGKKTGVVSMCIGTGMGAAAVIEAE